jgi:hypothetical protein
MTDTAQQKTILQSSAAARKVRKLFPPGTVVQTVTGAKGTVLRHVPSTNALGGSLTIKWDTGCVGRGISTILENVWPIDNG